MPKYMDLKYVSDSLLGKDLKTLSKNKKIDKLETFEALDNMTNKYESVEDLKYNEVKDVKETTKQSSEEESEEEILAIESHSDLEGKVIENFQSNDAGAAATSIIAAAGKLGDGLKPLVTEAIKNSKELVAKGVEELNSAEIKSSIKATTDSYVDLLRDSLTRSLADPDHQHRVDEYIIKPIWDLYLIPFIDMYVVFLILYYIIFVITIIWVIQSK